ncbi:response regulator transcription factor [Jatrophihabitans telluris]|uniref:Response regulator transcription factor n=1 Tax=Jatrophihabitans telluris TaxID=2038343 RepID=A0ABY4QWP5_9ACTN|nr:response regulator transcription factor [Jatrophihabitans telluris]UQX88091.1 response regulator transcription factor [Jatrophihabitans telluris]
MSQAPERPDCVPDSVPEFALDFVLVEDHLLLAETLRLALIDRALTVEILAPAPLPILQQALLSRRPALVLLDLDLGAFGDTTPMIQPLSRAGVRVLLVSGVSDPLRVAAAEQAGAIGFVAKADGFDTLLASAERARFHDGYLDPPARAARLAALTEHRAEAAARLGPFDRLTEREQQALVALAEGHSVRDIADDWFVSEATVRSHVRGVLTKLGTASQLGAVAAALRSGWLRAR